MKLPQPLTDHLGGRVLYVPKKPNDLLIQLLGDGQAQQFCHMYGGETIYVAKDHAGKTHQAHQAIIAHFDGLARSMTKGQALKETARAFGVSVRWIGILLKRR